MNQGAHLDKGAQSIKNADFPITHTQKDTSGLLIGFNGMLVNFIALCNLSLLVTSTKLSLLMHTTILMYNNIKSPGFGINDLNEMHSKVVKFRRSKTLN